jgi:hypothetical protein
MEVWNRVAQKEGQMIRDLQYASAGFKAEGFNKSEK